MRNLLDRASAVSASIAVCALAIPTAGNAAGFTPEGQQHWIGIAHNLIDAANKGTDEMGAACTGVSIMGGGSEIRREASQVPKWAVSAHFQACIAYQSVASRERGKGFMTSTTPCKQLKVAVDELGNAQPGVDPDDVVAVAGQLRSTLQSLADDYKEAKTCKFAVVRPF